MNNLKNTSVVLTTINKPDIKIRDWRKLTATKTVVIGDCKTPHDWNHKDCLYISYEEQIKSHFKTSKKVLKNHYTRKNIGYLWAKESGANCILDTDDDNFPYLEKWKTLMEGKGIQCYLKSSPKMTFKNIYSYFSNDDIPFWPRGFPLEKINCEKSKILNTDCVNEKIFKSISLYQCMVEGDPDIDAIHRLIFKGTPSFLSKKPIIMGKNNICPFNSQNTLWPDPKIHALLYLPSTVSFRFTDILRSYVAQFILNALSINWGFFPSTSYQIRNQHNLLKDMSSEVDMYLNTYTICNILETTVDASKSVEDNLHNTYSKLVQEGFVRIDEMPILDAWLDDISKF